VYCVSDEDREFSSRFMERVGADNLVYCDTDSLFMKYPKEATKDEIVKRGKAFLEKINAELPEAMELEYEGFYKRGVFIFPLLPIQ
jgi:DNA polymerase I